MGRQGYMSSEMDLLKKTIYLDKLYPYEEIRVQGSSIYSIRVRGDHEKALGLRSDNFPLCQIY